MDKVLYISQVNLHLYHLSKLAPVPSLSSNILHLLSDCDLVHLVYVPVALVASLDIISSLSRPYLSHIPRVFCSSSPGLYSSPLQSHIKSSSFISISMPTIESSFNPSIVPKTLSVSHVILTTYCFFNSTLNPFSLILMIMFVTIELCCFLGSSPIPVTYFLSIYPLIVPINYIQKCTPSSGNPLCTSK